MDSNTFYYTFNTAAQVVAALVALTAVFVLYRLSVFDDDLRHSTDLALKELDKRKGLRLVDSEKNVLRAKLTTSVHFKNLKGMRRGLTFLATRDKVFYAAAPKKLWPLLSKPAFRASLKTFRRLENSRASYLRLFLWAILLPGLLLVGACVGGLAAVDILSCQAFGPFLLWATAATSFCYVLWLGIFVGCTLWKLNPQ